jgi:hypothetical protein
MLGCLCDICQNVVLLLRLVILHRFGKEKIHIVGFRAIYQFILWVKQHGNPREKTAALNFEFVSSISTFIDLVLHPKV